MFVLSDGRTWIGQSCTRFTSLSKRHFVSVCVVPKDVQLFNVLALLAFSLLVHWSVSSRVLIVSILSQVMSGFQYRELAQYLCQICRLR
jgi:hypothetical protein